MLLKEVGLTENLNCINPGECVRVGDLLISGSMRQRLLDIGLTSGTRVECVGKSPSGDPKAFLIRGAVIAIRSEDTEKILIKKQ